MMFSDAIDYLIAAIIFIGFYFSKNNKPYKNKILLLLSFFFLTASIFKFIEKNRDGKKMNALTSNEEIGMDTAITVDGFL